MADESDSAFTIPGDANEFLTMAAQRAGIAASDLHNALQQSRASRSELLDVVWMQSKQNMALLQALVALAGDDGEAKAKRVLAMVEATKDTFDTMIAVSARSLKLSIENANDRAEGSPSGR